MTVYRAAARIISQRFVAANLLVSSRQATITARITCVGINEKMRLFGSDSITYSGGQASEGQGGFYGSGGARATSDSSAIVDSAGDVDGYRKKMIALSQDVDLIRETMIELDRLETLLHDSTAAPTSKEYLDLKHSIKKLTTQQKVLESLNNLEVNGEPTWGLSTQERELIILARVKVNEC